MYCQLILHAHPVKPIAQQLIKGYRVMVTQILLDLVTAQSTPTRMIRKLMSVFYSEDRLADSSCVGISNSEDVKIAATMSLDSNIIAASIIITTNYILQSYFTNLLKVEGQSWLSPDQFLWKK